ncbi:hypothetical protein AMTRI_Chr04g243260 [Amborella trichopoda]
MSSTLAMALSLLFLSVLDPVMARDHFSKEANSTADSKPSNILRDAYNHTKYCDFCVDAIGLDPNSRTAVLVGVSSIALKLEFDNITSTSNYVQQLWRRWNNSTLHMYLDGCNIGYPKAIEDLQATMDEFQTKDYKSTVYYMGLGIERMHDCLILSMECEDENWSKHMFLTPLSDMNLYFNKLLNIGFVSFHSSPELYLPFFWYVSDALL